MSQTLSSLKFHSSSATLTLNILLAPKTFIVSVQDSLGNPIANISGPVASIGTSITPTVAALLAGINSFQSRYVATLDTINPDLIYVEDTQNQQGGVTANPLQTLILSATVPGGFSASTSQFFTGPSATCPPCSTPSSTLAIPSNIFTIDGGVIDPCGGSCGAIGQTLGVSINQGFPVISVAVANVDSLFAKVFVMGDYSIIAPAGSTFDITGSTGNDGTYTVVTSTYDSLSDVTTLEVSTPIPSFIADGIVTNFSNCSGANRSVQVIITNQDSGLVVLDQTYTDTLDSYVITQTVSYVLAAYGKYSISYTASDCYSSVSQEVLIQICFNYKITKTDCHVYTIEDNDTSGASFGKINTVLITNQDGSYSQTFTINMAAVNFVSVTFPKDGIYKAVITNNLTSDVITMPIYDICDTIKCTKKLILEILCNDSDPCCKDCSDETKRKRTVQRSEMNKIIALGSVLIAQIRVDELNNLGVFTFDAIRELNLEQATNTFNVITDIIDRCGECKKTLINPVTPCYNC